MNDAFRNHVLNVRGGVKVQKVREAFDDLLEALTEHWDDELEVHPEYEGVKVKFEGSKTREASIVRTKLEEACFFAVRAVAVNPKNQTDV